MTYKELEKYYIWGLATSGKIYDFKLGIYDRDRESFRFSNGDLGSNELFKEPRGSNSVYVASAVCLQEVDDAGLLYKSDDNVEEIPQMEGTLDKLNALTLTK